MEYVVEYSMIHFKYLSVVDMLATLRNLKHQECRNVQE